MSNWGLRSLRYQFGFVGIETFHAAVQHFNQWAFNSRWMLLAYFSACHRAGLYSGDGLFSAHFIDIFDAMDIINDYEYLI